MQLDLFSREKTAVWTVRLAGRTVSYTLKRSSRAKHVWLRVGIGTGLEVIAPARMPLLDLDAILEKKASWIKRQFATAGHSEQVVRRPALKDGSSLTYMGEDHRLRVLVDGGCVPKIKLSGGEIVAQVPDGDPATLRDALEAWYRKMARKVITDRVARYSNGREVGRVLIKDQKTRWGSCSSRGNLSFNWRLVMAPPAVLDYLVVHELTHLEHPDHSKRFWAKISKRCPGYEEREAWLKEHGRGLALT